jgi:2-oxoisovalerate dehydrogenase E1 component alpha subunit
MIQFRHGHSASSPQAQPEEGGQLFNGIASTRFTSTAAFKDSVGEFEVLQQLNRDGSLVEGIDLPFSLDTAVKMYRTMVQSSVYDTILMELQRQGRISFYCSNFGEEATAVGSAAALSGEDMVWPHYRELGMFLWRGLTPQQIVDQNMGNEDDVGKGRNLQVHYCLPDANVQTVHAILGTQICQAPGAGYGYRLEGQDKVSVAYFGDGAASEGDALTALNFASVYKSQTLFICRNNGYSISTPVSDQYGGDGIAARGPAFGIPSIRVDGIDVVAVFNATKAARELSVREKTPVLIELMTYRLSHHTTSDDSSLYRPVGRCTTFCAWFRPIYAAIVSADTLIASVYAGGRTSSVGTGCTDAPTSGTARARRSLGRRPRAGRAQGSAQGDARRDCDWRGESGPVYLALQHANMRGAGADIASGFVTGRRR